MDTIHTVVYSGLPYYCYMYNTVSPQKKVYTCVKGKYSKARGPVVKTGPSLIFKFQEMATQEQNVSWWYVSISLNLECVAHPLLFIWPSSVFSTRLDKSVYFLLGETVMPFENEHHYDQRNEILYQLVITTLVLNTNRKTPSSLWNIIHFP